MDLYSKMLKAASAVLLISLLISCGRNTNTHLLDNEWFYSTQDNPETFIPLEAADFSSLPQYLPGGEGIIQLKTEFSLPEAYRGELLSLYLGRIVIADKTYFNGELIGRTGSFPPLWFSDWNKDRSYDIPQQLVRWDRDNELLISIYVNYEGLIDGNIQIGPKTQIDRVHSCYQFFHKDIQMLFSFLLFFFGIHHLFIYSRRKKDKEIFWFGMVSIMFPLCLTGLFLTSFPGFQYSQISIIPFLKTIGIFELLLTYFFIRFTESFFRMPDRPVIKRIIYIPSVILMIIYLLQVDFRAYKIFFAYFEFSLCIPSFYVIYLTILAYKRRQRGAGVFIICLIPTFLFILHDSILPIIIEGYPLLIMGIGLSLLLLIINMILGLDFVRDRNEAEILNIELDQKVYKRTSELQDANEKLSFASRKTRFIESYKISKRETEILNLILDGLSNDEIAEELDISIRTVSAHLYKMYKKMEVHSRLEIFAFFRESG